MLKFFSSLLIFSFFISCSGIRLIQEYDSISDNRINSLQEKTAKFFIKLDRQFGKQDLNYDNFISFYDDSKADINVLLVRNRALYKTSITQQQLESLLIQFNSLELLHKKGLNSKEEINIIKSAIENSFTAILQFQLSLKKRSNS
jgi:hypothetical protein